MPAVSRTLIQVFVQGIDGKMRAIDVGAEDTGRALAEQIAATLSIPASELVLSCAGKPIVDDASLESQSILADATIRVSLRIKGGSSFTPPSSA